MALERLRKDGMEWKRRAKEAEEIVKKYGGCYFVGEVDG